MKIQVRNKKLTPWQVKARFDEAIRHREFLRNEYLKIARDSVTKEYAYGKNYQISVCRKLIAKCNDIISEYQRVML